VDNLLSITDKIIHLKSIAIFEELSVQELAAVASFTSEQKNGAREILIKEYDLGEILYLMVEGEVSVIKGYRTENQSEITRLQAVNYFGEMALFDDGRRSATIRTEMPSRFLTLHKLEFGETVREYPQIGLNAVRVLSARLRRYGKKVAESSSCRAPQEL
jgi:CRP-like cAMP-binding protein